MSGGESGGGVFSFGRNSRDAFLGRTLTPADIGTGVVIPEPVHATIDAYSPYAAAWKEFDRLEKSAKNKGLAWGHGLIGLLPGALSLVDPHKHLRLAERGTFVLIIATVAMQALRSRWDAMKLAHWPCPRCHSEWPGTKREKDPRCAVCGLKLRQMAP
jgi:hypothetical protein